ncbi:unnamed protein product, partial [Didymodactylos carnosus]
KIIDTPQFQRLRRIKQLSATDYVFPGASHNRFEHSIGTCYIAGELLTLLQQQQPHLDITDQDRICVQIAALCHDLGHGPFSHLFEDVIRETRPDRNWTHEEASIKLFDYLTDQNNLKPMLSQYKLDDTDIIFIKELIAGPLPEFNGKIVSNRRTGIDVDKFDYFVRDCRQSGVLHSFEYKRFMKFYRVLQLDNGTRELCIRVKEVRSCYDLYRTRAERNQNYQLQTFL